MRTFFRRTGTGVVALVVGSCALTGTARADADAVGAASRGPVAQHPAAAGARGGQVCRRGEVRPVPRLTARAQVCMRFANGSWVGSGQLVLTATTSVTGAFSWGPGYHPSRPSGFAGSRTFSLAAGQTVTYGLPGTTEADPADTGADWTVWVGVPNGIWATGFEAQVTSPVAGRRPSADQPSRFPGRTRWVCGDRRVSGQTLSGVATLCVRQVRGMLESKASLTYTSTNKTDVSVGLTVDGVNATRNLVPIEPSAHARRTVTLPTSTAQARRQDHRAATFLDLQPVRVLSPVVPVR